MGQGLGVTVAVAVGGMGADVGVGVDEGLRVCVEAGDVVRVGETVGGREVRVGMGVGAGVGEDTGAAVGKASGFDEQPVWPIVSKSTVDRTRCRDFTASLLIQSSSYSTPELKREITTKSTVSPARKLAASGLVYSSKYFSNSWLCFGPASPSSTNCL